MLSSYVAEAESLLAKVRGKVESLDALPTQRAPTLRELDADFVQLDSLSRLLDIELRRGGAGDGAPTSTAVATARHVVQEIRTLRDRKQKAELLLTEGAEGSDTRLYHGRFKNTSERLQASTEVLNESRRNMMDTEAVAAGIAEKLLENRQTIESSHNKLLETGGLMGRAHRAMRSMQKRETQRKLFLLAAVVFVVLLLLWAVISLFSGGGGNSAPVVPVTTQAPSTVSPTSGGGGG
jgi:hypothetical protein